MTPIPIDALPAALAADLDRAFPQLVQAVQDDLYSGALRMTGNHADAEDVTQEALIRAHRALAAYPPDRIEALRLRGWVWTIAANLCRNRARARARRPEAPLPDGEIPDESVRGPEESALAADTAASLVRHLAGLPPAQREAVVLRHVVGLGYAEIADALRRPVGTVKADVHRALARLRALTTEEEPA